MSTYTYTNWSVKARSDLVLTYVCEQCGARNMSVKSIEGFGSRNDDHQAKWSKSYAQNLTNDHIMEMGREATEAVQKKVKKYEWLIQSGQFHRCVKRKTCSQCGAYQSFMRHTVAMPRFIVWLALNIILLYGLISTVLRAVNMGALLELLPLIVGVPLEIVFLIFLFRNAKRLKKTGN